MARNIKRNTAESYRPSQSDSSAHAQRKSANSDAGSVSWYGSSEKTTVHKSDDAVREMQQSRESAGWPDRARDWAADDKGTWASSGKSEYRDRSESRSEGTGFGKSVLIGLAGGLAATWIMTQAQTALNKKLYPESQKPKSEAEQKKSVDEQSTVKVADRAAHAMHQEIPQRYKQTAGNAVHYGYGTLMGGVFGALSSAFEEMPIGIGLLFATGLWVIGDEIVLPKLGLSKAPTEKDAKEHAYEAGVHAVYGLALDLFSQLGKKIA